MAEQTKIQWCDDTFNPWTGCTKVAEGCEHCYAENLMDTRFGRVQWGPKGTRKRTKTWGDPVRWNIQAALAGKRRKVFCASLADIFEDYQGSFPAEGLDPWRAELFQLIDRCPSLDFLLLTKRPQNVRLMWQGQNRSNCWIGTSISNQKNADEYIPRLLGCRGLGSVLFLSIEPQIGPIDLSRYLIPRPVLDWVIVGGESKQGRMNARSFDLEWARTIVRQCRDAGVPCFVKQMGSRPHEQGLRSRHSLQLVDRHGGDWEEWPDDLRVRQCPETGLLNHLVQ